MVLVNRKLVEDYYKKEWSQTVSSKTVSLLIELTCQAYKLNEPQIPSFIKQKEVPRPQNLGQI